MSEPMAGLGLNTEGLRVHRVCMQSSASALVLHKDVVNISPNLGGCLSIWRDREEGQLLDGIPEVWL